MHPIGRIALASHALPVAAILAPGPAWPWLAAWGSVQGAVMWHLLRPRSTLIAPNVVRLEEEHARVALTWDDGPRAEETDRLLDLLDAAGVKGTFFMVGLRARTHPEIVRRIAASGHALGNHSWSHPPLWSMASRRRVLAEVGDAQKAIADAAGRPPRWFRPPVGHKNFHLAEALEAHGLTQVTWSLRSFDTVLRDEHRVLRRVLKRAREGEIILLHEGIVDRGGAGPLSIRIAGLLLDGLAGRGLSPVSLPSPPTTPPSATPAGPDVRPRTSPGSSSPPR